MKVMLDAGHGYQTPGKRSPDGMKEYDFNRAVAAYAKLFLDKHKGVEVYFSHSDKEDVPLHKRAALANSIGVDIFISIHANAFGDGTWNNACGIETFVHTSKPKQAISLAKKIQSTVTAMTGLPDRGVKTANFQVLRETKCPAVLVECGFMTNRQEAKLLQSNHYRKLCAKAITISIAGSVPR
ncbi:N-acetylmuramoyl-L-alanine amidase [Peribacillus glennii]|uniref:N-acetylmuramoyl-L-alanine amidase n=1 Tax=Peribacillus glennii TaxID=2303991 RepID=A0A372LD30_9BACI|nr:N-acetylmuramoyl-L-alanine amidase [Peribacillus glennii]RFU63902.1 N-acetylmuramoyl-L-alanine amidase [Peribacillus glennii]